MNTVIGIFRDASPSARDRRLVFARAFGCCEGCGASVIGRPYSIQPRAERSPGGFTRTGVNALANLTLLCGSPASADGCRRLSAERDQDLHDRGIWLWPWENPRLVPVLVSRPEGPRTPVWLNDEGTYDAEPPSIRTRLVS
jgi:hypothetical protein